jgi:hypothetical protein
VDNERQLYRYRWSCQIIYGSYADFFEIERKKEMGARERGWKKSSLWVTTSGNLNDFFEQRDYERFDELARDLAVREADYDYMKLMRASYKLVVQGSVRIEFFRTATPA